MGTLLEPMVARRGPATLLPRRLHAHDRGGQGRARGRAPRRVRRIPAWTEAWDLAFADLYLEALERWNEDGSAPGPWQVAFASASDGAARAADPPSAPGDERAHQLRPAAGAARRDRRRRVRRSRHCVARRGRDHRHIDEILASRVAEEDRLLRAVEIAGRPHPRSTGRSPPATGGPRARFLAESRAKVWRNARLLSLARRDGPGAAEGAAGRAWARCPPNGSRTSAGPDRCCSACPVTGSACCCDGA